MATINQKREEERKKAVSYNQEIFGDYYEQVKSICSEMKKDPVKGLVIQGKVVIGIAKTPEKEPCLVFSGSDFVPFSKIDFSKY